MLREFCRAPGIAGAFLFLWASLLSAANSITNVLANDLAHGSVRIVANIAVDGYAQVLWGYASGSYPNATTRYVTASPQLVFSGGGCTVEPSAYVLTLSSGAISYIQLIDPGSGCTSTPSITVNPILGGSGANITPIMSGGAVANNGPAGFNIINGGSGYIFGPGGGNFNAGSGQVAAAIGGLTPSTTYYFVIRVCPDVNDDTGCFTSSEYNFTTLPDPGHPVYPAPPTSTYNPSYPNTASGYTTIALAGNGSQECYAASTVGPISYGGTAPGPLASWTVHANDTLTTILGEVGYGAIIELPQGVTCQVPDNTPGVCGYEAPTLSVDPAASGIDDPNHRWIIIRTHAVNATDFPPFGYRLEASWHGLNKVATLQAQQPCNPGNPGPNAQIMEFSSSSLSYPVHHIWISNVETAVKSSASNGPWSEMFLVGVANEGSPGDSAHVPDYIVLDRLYFPGPAYPVQSTGFVRGTPAKFAILNSHADSMDCLGCVQGVYVTTGGSGPITVDNLYLDARFQGIYLEKNPGDNCNFSGYCPAYSGFELTHSTLRWPLSTLYNTNWSHGWDGVTRQFRNQLETKTCRNCIVRGNVIDGQWSYQNEGSAIFLSDAGATEITGVNILGSTDFLIDSNLIRNTPNVLNCLGVQPLTNTGPPDSAVNSRITFHNNLAYSLGKYLFQMTGLGASLLSGYVINEPGCQDFNVMNNTFGFNNADSGSNGFYFLPDVFTYGGGGPLQEGAYTQNNVLFLSQGVVASQTGIIGDTSWISGYCCSNYLPSPQVVAGPPSTTVLNSAVVRMSSAGLVPNWTWNHNVIICGNKATGAEPWPDQTSSDCATNAAGMPAGDLYPIAPSPAPQTMAAREAAAGLLNVANNDYTCTPTAENPCAAGVDMAGLESALGIVSHITAEAGPTELQFSYIAPDSRSCSIDTSPDGVNWTRTADAGGSRQRTLAVTGLSASTMYQYQVLCYYDQTVSWFSFPSDPTSNATSGSISTAPVAARSLSVAFQLPAGAAAAQFTVTGIGGSPVTQRCSSSPCAISGVPSGNALVQVAYQTSGGQTVSNGSFFVQ